MNSWNFFFQVSIIKSYIAKLQHHMKSKDSWGIKDAFTFNEE